MGKRKAFRGGNPNGRVGETMACAISAGVGVEVSVATTKVCSSRNRERTVSTKEGVAINLSGKRDSSDGRSGGSCRHSNGNVISTRSNRGTISLPGKRRAVR